MISRGAILGAALLLASMATFATDSMPTQTPNPGSNPSPNPNPNQAHEVNLNPVLGPKRTPYHHCMAQAAPGTVALTFDDGPGKDTPSVLAILQHYHIHATFFILGEKAIHNPLFLRQVVEEGNVIGDHSMTHPQFTHLKDEQQWYNEVVVPADIIQSIAGLRPQLFRFPYGATNEQTTQYVMSKGFIPVSWGYDSEDWRRPGSADIARRVIQNAASGQVILFHDGPARREQTVAALPQIIEGIQKKGLGFSVLCS